MASKIKAIKQLVVRGLVEMGVIHDPVGKRTYIKVIGSNRKCIKRLTSAGFISPMIRWDRENLLTIIKFSKVVRKELPRERKTRKDAERRAQEQERLMREAALRAKLDIQS